MSGPVADILKVVRLPDAVCAAFFDGKYAYVAIVNGARPNLYSDWLQAQPEGAALYEVCDGYSDYSTGNLQIFINFPYRSGDAAFNSAVKRLAMRFKLTHFDSEKWTSHFDSAS